MQKPRTILYLAILAVLVSIVGLGISYRALIVSETRLDSVERRILSHNEDVKFEGEYIDFAGDTVPLNMFEIRERFERELLSNAYFHSSTMILIKRATRWFPVIEPILAKNGIPDDFKYLCVIESSLTNAVSPAGATGFWQFMEKTGKHYGLTINKEVDMRYNVELETEAACKYFKESYEKFHNWTLVAASFNAGMKGIERFMKAQKANNYYDLLMSNETERYIFRILAVKTIFRNPERYGLFVSKTYKPFKYTTVIVDYDVDDWADFAISHGITYKLLKVFNPWLRKSYLKVKKGTQYEVKIPIKPFDLTYEDCRQMHGMDFDTLMFCDSIQDYDSLMVDEGLDTVLNQ